MVGLHRKNLKYRVISDVLMLILCVAVFYSIQFAAKKSVVIAPLQIITVPFLGGIVFYFYKVCNAQCFHKIYQSKVGGWTIMCVSGLCLESYLIQNSLFTDKLNWMFPFNLPIIYISILLVAYCVRCLARIFSQTFRTEDYEWRKIFSI